MANAHAVLKEAIDEASLLSRSEGSMEEIQTLLDLAQKAFAAGDGELDDDEVRNGGLHATGLSHLGL